MNLNGKKYTYNFLRVSKHPTPFPPEDEVEEVDSLCFVETLRDPLRRKIENQIKDQQDDELEEATKGLEPQDGSIELHAPTNSTQKLKLMRKGGQFTYTPTLPLTCRLPQAEYVEYWSGL
jgi:hypothetical protein